VSKNFIKDNKMSDTILNQTYATYMEYVTYFITITHLCPIFTPPQKSNL